jgi:CO dehydrogenase/acetyl-CoA synthase delta subunit
MTRDFDSIYQEFKPPIFRYLCHLCDEANDQNVTHAVFRKISQFLDSFQGEEVNYDVNKSCGGDCIPWTSTLFFPSIKNRHYIDKRIIMVDRTKNGEESMQKIKLIIHLDSNDKVRRPVCSNNSKSFPMIEQKTCCSAEKKTLPLWATGTIATPAGTVLKISSSWTRRDYLGMVKSRMSAFRMHYSIAAGLYAVGEPTMDSEIFVSANYKLSFDVLRRELKEMDAWILVLDTKGINVWCAAGKGTFGTDELIKRILEVNLGAVVSHRRIILPQLSAVGVSAGIVQKKTEFQVSFGPVRAQDIPAYVLAKCKKTPEMSTIRFSIFDRLILTPMEINPVIKKYPWFAATILLVFGIQPSGILFAQAWHNGLPFLFLGFVSIIAGALLTPVLLPFVPFRSFAIKGWIVGILTSLIATQIFNIIGKQNIILVIVTWLFFPAMSSYIALQFTGATTFTGMSGVKKELKVSVPLYIGAACISTILMVLFKIKEWGLL